MQASVDICPISTSLQASQARSFREDVQAATKILRIALREEDELAEPVIFQLQTLV